jgi:hypothetical protein
MALNAKNIKGNNKERVQQANLEADVYRARVVQILDLGLQPQRPYQGKEKPPANEIQLTYELCDEFMKDEDGNDIKDKPRWISETLPFYGLFADKAKSTMRYNAFDPSGEFDGDFSKCSGIPVNVTVVNNSVGDKIYDNVGNVAPMSAKKAATCPELVNPAKVFDLDVPDMEVFNALPEWLRDKIKSNLNYQGSVLQQKLGKAGNTPQKEGKKDSNVREDNPKIAGLEDQSNNPY